MNFVIFRIINKIKTNIYMKLSERLNVLIQAVTLSQKSGVLTFDDSIKAKSAIDVISSGILDQNFTSAINALIELVVSSQKKGAYSLKDAHMIYLAVNGIEEEFQNEIKRINEEIEANQPFYLEYVPDINNN